MGFGKQVAAAAREPWLLLTSGIGGGLGAAARGGEQGQDEQGAVHVTSWGVSTVADPSRLLARGTTGP